MTFDPLYFENFLELEHHRCLITQPCAVNTQAKKKSLTADSSPVDSVGKVFAGYIFCGALYLKFQVFPTPFATVTYSSHNLCSFEAKSESVDRPVILKCACKVPLCLYHYV